MDNKNSRRQFFTRAGQFLGVALIAPQIVSSIVLAEERRRPRPEGGAAAGGGGAGGASAGGGDTTKPWVDPKSDQAKAVNFVTKKSDLKKAELKTDRAGVKWDSQFCKGCQFYTAAGKKDGKDCGACTILAGNLVPSEGWCASWAKKA